MSPEIFSTSFLDTFPSCIWTLRWFFPLILGHVTVTFIWSLAPGEQLDPQFLVNFFFQRRSHRTLFFYSGSCVYNLTNPQGNFTSPNHPSPHQHYLNCFWTITAAPGDYIHLYFLYFHLEYGSSYCPYDYVEVTDPNYPTSSIKIKRCGYQSPWCVTSTSNVMYVRFVTDLSVAYSGFFASYTNHSNPFSGNCSSLNATQIQTTQGK